MYYNYHNHTVQVARVQVGFWCQWLEGKTAPGQVATGDDHHVCKWSVCASWTSTGAIGVHDAARMWDMAK